MLSNAYLSTALRFVVLAALQILVFAHLGESTAWGPYAQVMLYPLVILLLPVQTPSFFVLLLAFALGCLIDFSLGTYGLHASALVFTAFARRLILGVLEPREGYGVDQSPTRSALGMRWFVQYAALLMGVHLLTFFAVEAFTLVYIVQILARAVGSFCVSMTLILLYMIVLDPRS